MATTTDLGNVNIFSSLASFNSNKANLKSNDLNFIKQTAAEMATVGGGIVDELLEENGYVKFANGLILQWGVVTSYGVTVNFPVAYSTQIFCLTVFHSANGTSTLDLYARRVMLNKFTFIASAPDSQFKSFERAYWLSIGV